MVRDLRAAKTVLVPEAHTLGAIGAIRSLGRAGYTVVAMSPEPDALGFRSRFAARAELSPRYDAPDYIEWLERFLTANPAMA